VHDSHIKKGLIFDDKSSELTLPHASISVKVVEYFDISVELKRSALPFGLFDPQDRQVVFEFVVNKFQ